MTPTAQAPFGLSLTGAQRIRRITIVTVFLLAVAAAVLSFAGLQQLAIEAGYSPELAWLLPLVIDGLVITGSLGVVASSLVGVSTWYPWLLTMLGVVASVAGNVAVANDDFMSRAVHATPPLALALAVEGLIRIYRVGAVALVRGASPPAGMDAHEQPTAAVAEEDAKATSMQAVLQTEAPAAAARVEDVPAMSSDTNGTLEESLRQAPAVSVDSPPLPTENVTPASVVPPQNSSSDTPSLDTGNEIPVSIPASGTTRERLRILLQREPDITGNRAAQLLGTDPSHTRKILRELRTPPPK